MQLRFHSMYIMHQHCIEMEYLCFFQYLTNYDIRWPLPWRRLISEGGGHGFAPICDSGVLPWTIPGEGEDWGIRGGGEAGGYLWGLGCGWTISKMGGFFTRLPSQPPYEPVGDTTCVKKQPLLIHTFKVWYYFFLIVIHARL